MVCNMSCKLAKLSVQSLPLMSSYSGSNRQRPGSHSLFVVYPVMCFQDLCEGGVGGRGRGLECDSAGRGREGTSSRETFLACYHPGLN